MSFKLVVRDAKEGEVRLPPRHKAQLEQVLKEEPFLSRECAQSFCALLPKWMRDIVRIAPAPEGVKRS